MGGIFGGLGKLQNDLGIDTAYSRAYRHKKADKVKNQLSELIAPYINEARRDQTGGIDIDKDFNVLSGILPQKKTSNERLRDLFPVNSNPDRFALSSPPEQKPTQNSGISYRDALSTQEWMRKHGYLLAPLGYKQDDVQMGMMSPEENYDAAKIKNKLELSAKENADVQNERAKQRASNTFRALDAGDKNFRTAVEYGGDNDLTDNLNYALQTLGLDDLNYNSYPDKKGTKVTTAESQVRANDARANASNSTAWRNYNKPPGSSRGGSGGSKADAKLAEARAIMSVYNSNGKLGADGEWKPYTPAEQIKFNQAAEYIKAHDPEWNSGKSYFAGTLSGSQGGSGPNIKLSAGGNAISREEYNNLLQRGFTPARIAAEGFYLAE